MGGMVTGLRRVWRRRYPWSVKLFRQGNTRWYKIRKNTEELWNVTLFRNPKQVELEYVCGGPQDVGEITEAFWFLISSSVKWECSLALNDTSVVTRIKISRSCAGWGLCWSILLRGGGAPSPAWLHLPSLSLLLICLPRAGGLYLIWKKEMFVFAAARIKYVVTFLLRQGLLLFSNERLSFPPMETVWSWIIIIEHRQKWWHEETKEQIHSITAFWSWKITYSKHSHFAEKESKTQSSSPHPQKRKEKKRKGLLLRFIKQLVAAGMRALVSWLAGLHVGVLQSQDTCLSAQFCGTWESTHWALLWTSFPGLLSIRLRAH